MGSYRNVNKLPSGKKGRVTDPKYLAEINRAGSVVLAFYKHGILIANENNINLLPMKSVYKILLMHIFIVYIWIFIFCIGQFYL